ncbi:YccV-like-domain-containing protein [Saccharata proteae CBS 121410]|uniref:YccV-like-domain-containing protein n=1 Tax=Saccharata proteae CBS 121410 TaxID=1314787 RepID=A0A9P4HQX2_9PEZI|nr:YccV-like-domain-containing protein [Saccharata proteae CBS 121410]
MGDLAPTEILEAASLLSLPDELLSSILLHLDPETLSVVQLVSKRIYFLTQEPLLWRFQCKSQYGFWNPKYRLAFQQPIESVDWKAAFVDRRQKDEFASRQLEGIIASRRERYRRIESIAELGFDVCDLFARRKHERYATGDNLARSFWNNAAAGTVYRSKAIREWIKLKNGEPVSLERALGAYDMFVWDSFDGNADFEDLENKLDALAAEIRNAIPDFRDLSTRQKAWKIVKHLRVRSFNGVPDERYNHLKNSFIGLALQNPEHEALPLITVAIYCCIAQRLGLSASPCAYPYHVFGIVYAPAGQTLDGAPLPPGVESLDAMYVDPFRSTEEVSRSDLEAQLRVMGASPSTFDSYLGPADTRELVLRTARNIRRSVEEINRSAMLTPHGSIPNPRADSEPDFDSAFYAALWAWLILDKAGDEGDEHAGGLLHRRRVLVSHLVEQYQMYFAWDNFLVERHILPLFQNLGELEELSHIIHVQYREDEIKIPARRRPQASDENTRNVPYRVGQVFRHKRYSYYGVITGWDRKCEAGGEWMRQMNVDSLPGGGNQSFYHVLVEDRSARYVAEENINITTERPPPHLLKWAGQYMKTWSDEEGRFISNIQEEYPDD